MLNRSVAMSGKVACFGDRYGCEALVFHHRLIAFLDVNGNVRADEYWLKSNVMPRVSGCSPEDCRKYALGLVEEDLAVEYEVDGMPYLHFPGFREHQVGLRTNRESPEVPVPHGFDESSGSLPEGFRKVSGKDPAEVEVEGEVEEEPRNSARARGEPNATEEDHVANGRRDDRGPVRPDLRGSDTDDPLEILLQTDTFSDTYAALLACWAEANHPDGVPSSVADQQREAGHRLVDRHDPETLARMVFGIGMLFPHSAGEGWNLRDLELKGDKALKAARDGGARKQTQADRNIEAIMTAELE